MKTRRMSGFALTMASLPVGAPSAAQAQTGTPATVTYTYDAQGHLVRAEHAGGRNDGVRVEAGFDVTDNRTTLQVTGRSRANVVVVPLNGLKVIPIP
jgi:hypothetical protein